MRFFDREPETKFQVVELAPPMRLPAVDSNIAASIATLQGHPGFTYLLQKLRLQRAMLVSALANTRQESLKDVEFLQSGVAWTGFVEAQLMKAIGYREAPEAPKQTPFEAEREAFEEAQKFIEVLK